MPVLAFIGGLGPWELGIILLIVLIFFGAGKLPQVFESFGKGVKAFRDAQKDESIDVTPDDPKALSDHPDVDDEPVRERTRTKSVNE